MPDRVVIYTNVLVSALKSEGGPSRRVLRLCLAGALCPLIGLNLLAEYEDVLSRSELFEKSGLSECERNELLDALLSVSEWVTVYFLWRPNLPDEGDNHLLELAIAGSATKLITHNTRDFRLGELRFPSIRIITPQVLLDEWSAAHGNDDN